MPVRIPSLFRRRGEAPPDFDGVLVLRHGRPYDPAWDRWRPIRRWPGILVSAIVTMGLLVAISYHLEDHIKTTSPNISRHISTSAFVRKPYFPPVATDTEKVETFSGNTSQYDVSLTSPGGLTQWNFLCQCSANFDVTVYDSKGAIVNIPINLIGHVDVAAVANYPAGQYYMNIQADGPWDINFVPEGGLPVIDRSFSYFSKGTSVLGPFPPSDNYLIVGYLASLGQLLTVQVVDKNNNIVSTPIFTIRDIDHTDLTLSNLPNPYYLIVEGEGEWVLKVEPAADATS